MNAGDHLASQRTGYSHHGIYVGGNQVIHYSGFADGMSKGAIALTSLEEFSRGNSCQVIRHLVTPYSPDEVVDRAYARLGEDWYNLLLNNCEHFATWCVVGLHSSKQVNAVLANAMLANRMAGHFSQKDLLLIGRHSPELLSLVKTALGAGGNQMLPVAAGGIISAGNLAGVAAGVTTGTALTAGAGTIAVGVASAGVAAAIAPIAGAVAVGYGVKKLIDICFD